MIVLAHRGSLSAQPRGDQGMATLTPEEQQISPPRFPVAYCAENMSSTFPGMLPPPNK
jgi:hypothetical protein